MDGVAGQGAWGPARAGAVVVVLVAVIGMAAPRARAAVPGDFNGDGHADLAIGAPGEDPGAAPGAGQVTVLYATRAGRFDPAGQAFNEDTDGAGGGAAPQDHFGAALAVGDFDGDGRADLAIGAPGADAGAGVVTVLRGSPSGLQPAGAQAFFESLAGSLASSAGAGFGEALAAGDLNGDGRDDLAVGAPGAGTDGAGEVVVLYGSSGGLSTADARVLTAPGPSQLFGAALATGDFDANGIADLAVGAPGVGAVDVVPGAAGRLGALAWTASHDAAGVAGPTGGAFGATLAAGDFNHDGAADLAVGAPGAAVGGQEAAGHVAVMTGAAGRGLGDTATAGLDGAGGGDLFGAALATGDFNRDGSQDLAIGAPGATLGGVPAAGRALVVYGAPAGLNVAGAQSITQGPALHTNNDPGDEFAGALAATDLTGNGTDDLVIGAPGENTNSSAGDALDGAGQLLVLHGGPGGVVARNAQKLSQDGSVPDNSEGGDAFAFALAG
jgi:hypothetical protein